MSMLSKFVEGIGKKAPIIGDILAIAVPGASKVLPIIHAALGTKTEKEIVHALENDPDAYMKLKKAEMDHKVELKRIRVEETKAYLADTQSARQREVEFVKATGARDWFQTIIGTLIVSAFICVLFMVFFVEIPTANERLADIVLGILGTLTIGIVNYLFGTSKSSADKTSIISNIRKEHSK